MIEVPKQCQVCYRECHALRCQQCRAAWYCSVDCQRKDWKKQHRRICKANKNNSINNINNNKLSTTQQSSMTITSPPVQVQKAWEELVGILDGKSTTELYKDYTLVNDAMNTFDESTEESINSTPNTTKLAQPRETSSYTANKETNSLPNKSQTVNQHLLPSPNSTPGASTIRKYWYIYIEEMSNIFCYQILLRPTSQNHKLVLDNFKLNIRNTDPYERKKSTLYFCYYQLPNCPQPPTEIGITFPRSIIPNTHRVSLVDNNEAISIRLSYDMTDIKNMDDNVRKFDLLSPSHLHWIRCRTCQNNLFSSTTTSDDCTIHQVLPLPSGQFDEMEDYLMCYDGQPAVDFNVVSAAAKKGSLLEDETVLVVHPSDIPDTVCVVAQTGYGEEEESFDVAFNQKISEDGNDDDTTDEKKLSTDDWGAIIRRGTRPWRDKVGGATVTCSLCASTLGYAPIDMLGSYRLLKHRLELQPIGSKPLLQNNVSNPFPSIGTFIVQEMIRYAESTAIFSFQILMNPELSTSKHSKQNRRRRCLYLRLLSWDSLVCKDTDFHTNSNGVFEISRWNRSAKIIYEQAKMDTSSRKGPDQLENNSIWKWAQTDWCCPPRTINDSWQEKNNDDNKKSTDSPGPSLVRLYISRQEWEELFEELENSSKRFSNEVKEAIILTKTGLSTQGRGNVGLACIPLLSS